MSSFQFNAIQGALDLVNPPQGSNYLFQYYSDGEFAGADILGYEPVYDRVIIGNQAETYGFFPTGAQKLSVNDRVTAIGGDEPSFGFDLIRILSTFSMTVDPRANTGSGLGASIYSSFGGNVVAAGNKNWTGIPFGAGSIATSVIGGFGNVNIRTTGGTLDGAAGILFTATHEGYGGAVTYMLGALFDAQTTDGPAAGTPSGSLLQIVGGLFSVTGSGVGATWAASGWFFEPSTFNGGTGAPIPTFTYKTAIQCQGTLSISSQNVATAASITGLQPDYSVLYFTGSTATNWHGMKSDIVFQKLIFVSNKSSANVTIKHQSATEGTANNRFDTHTGADYVLAPGHGVTLHHDGSRWRIISRT